MHCHPAPLTPLCNDLTAAPDGSAIKWLLDAREYPPCADHAWEVRILAIAPDCASTESEGVTRAESLASAATHLVAHLEAPWLEAIAAREARGTPPASPPTAAEDTSATPPPTQGPA